jgi:hypothetical protein
MIGTSSADSIMARGRQRHTSEAVHMTAPRETRRSHTGKPLQSGCRPHMTGEGASPRRSTHVLVALRRPRIRHPGDGPTLVTPAQAGAQVG